jgi:hypothetical protein
MGYPSPLFSVVLNSFILQGLWIMACNSFIRLDEAVTVCFDESYTMRFESSMRRLAQPGGFQNREYWLYFYFIRPGEMAGQDPERFSYLE